MLLVNNLISIGLGLLACALPILYFVLKRHRELFCCGSLVACALSLYFQLREIMRWADLKDFAAIDDTINGICFCATMLLLVTLVLNAIILFKERKT